MFSSTYAVAMGIIEPDICDEIVRIGEQLDDMSGETENGIDSELSLARNSTVSWFTQWQAEKFDLEFDMIYSHVFEKFNDVTNEAGWGHVDITKSQAFQYTRYGPGQHYDWHPDQHLMPYADGDDQGLIRKMSMTLTLSEPEDFTGGEFMIEDHFRGGPNEYWHRIKNVTALHALPRGSIIAFPSYAWHQVKPVKSGERKSLVGWFLGPEWK